MEVVNEVPSIDGSKVPLCNCINTEGQKERYAVVKISKTEKNPGREFWACQISKANGGCGYFAFADEIITDPKTNLARRKYVKREKVVQADEQKTTVSQLEERLANLEFCFEDLKQRLKNLEEEVVRTENEPQSKAQKINGYNARGKTRPKILS